MFDRFWSSVLVDGAVLSAALGAVIAGSLAYEPRVWLNDAPPRVRMLAPPLTPAERRTRAAVGALFVLTLIGVTAWSAARLPARYGEPLSIGTIFLHFVGVFFFFNLFDLLVIDWLLLLVLRPRFVMRLSVPGLSYEETVGTYGYHFRAFLKGTGFIIVASLIAASLTYFAL
jgi:hypothetical protein